MLIEKLLEFNKPLYIVFNDYQKAFYTLLHSSIWEGLISQEVPLEYIQVLKKKHLRQRRQGKAKKYGEKHPENQKGTKNPPYRHKTEN